MPMHINHKFINNNLQKQFGRNQELLDKHPTPSIPQNHLHGMKIPQKILLLCLFLTLCSCIINTSNSLCLKTLNICTHDPTIKTISLTLTRKSFFFFSPFYLHNNISTKSIASSVIVQKSSTSLLKLHIKLETCDGFQSSISL